MTAIAVEHVRTTPRVTARVPTTRVIGVELQKMFDTRSGFWMMASILITAVLATAALIVFAPEEELVYGSFAGAIGMPMAVILPMVAILAVTSEWSQRSGLTTFTLVPHRGRVIWAKAVGTLAVGIGSMVIAFSVGALGNLIGTAITGTALTWDITMGEALQIVLANILGMFVGFMLGVLFRNSAGAIVAYFVYSLVLPGLLALLASTQDWFRDLQPWVDFNFAQTALFNEILHSEQWANLAVAGSIWLLAPLAVGLVAVLRSEVK
jgi:hypothetical protein